MAACRVLCESHIVQLRLAVNVLVVPYSVQLAMHLLVCYLNKFIQLQYVITLSSTSKSLPIHLLHICYVMFEKKAYVFKQWGGSNIAAKLNKSIFSETLNSFIALIVGTHVSHTVATTSSPASRN